MPARMSSDGDEYDGGVKRALVPTVFGAQVAEEVVEGLPVEQPVDRALQ